MATYRIHVNGELAGCIAARSEDVALAYAIGKYGAGSSVERVATKMALDAVGICVLVETTTVRLDSFSDRTRTHRVLT